MGWEDAEGRCIPHARCGLDASILTQQPHGRSQPSCATNAFPQARGETALGAGVMASLLDAPPSLPVQGLCQRERKPTRPRPWQVLLRLGMTFPSGLRPRDSVTP